MTNYQRWLIYTEKLPSPQSFIDFGFYFLISAALQRRVWMSSGESSVFPNQFTLLVGPPAVGKGLILGRVANVLRHHRNERAAKVKTSIGMEFPPLFPEGGDATTVEALTARMADCTSGTAEYKGHKLLHSSMYFCLEELATLFRKKQEDVVKFLLKAYDCKDHDYYTKKNGVDRIRFLCLSLMAGVQGDVLRTLYKSGIFDDGFTSRCLMLFENTPRFYKFHIDSEGPEQKAMLAELTTYVRKLSTVCGPVTYDQETFEWLETWMAGPHAEKLHTASERLMQYFGRKPVILRKLAMAVHFSENTDMTITIEDFTRALNLLDGIEPRLVAGLEMTGRNELNRFTRAIHAYIAKHEHGVTKQEIIIKYIVDLSMQEIMACIQELEMSGKIRIDSREGKECYKNNTGGSLK